MEGRERGSCALLYWEGQGLFLDMGRSPIPPHLGMRMRQRRWVLCGGHSLCEHVPSDKLTSSFACDSQRTGAHALSDKPVSGVACGIDRFLRPIIRMRPPQEVLRTAYGDSVCGGHGLCGYVLPGKLASSAACDSQRTGAHALSDKPVSGIACRIDRLLHPIIRVRPPQETRIFYKICRHG